MLKWIWSVSREICLAWVLVGSIFRSVEKLIIDIIYCVSVCVCVCVWTWVPMTCVQKCQYNTKVASWFVFMSPTTHLPNTSIMSVSSINLRYCFLVIIFQVRIAYHCAAPVCLMTLSVPGIKGAALLNVHSMYMFLTGVMCCPPAVLTTQRGWRYYSSGVAVYIYLPPVYNLTVFLLWSKLFFHWRHHSKKETHSFWHNSILYDSYYLFVHPCTTL